MGMLKPEAVKIIDDKDIRSPINYDEGHKLYYYVIDKGNEEEKLKNDISENLFNIDRYPFFGVSKGRLLDSYDTVRFVTDFHLLPKSISEKYDLIYDHPEFYPHVNNSTFRSGSKKLMNEFGCCPIMSFHKLFIAYIVFSYCYFEGDNDILYFLLRSEYINDFNLENPGYFVEINFYFSYSIRLNQLIHPDNDGVFCIFNHEYFSDWKKIKNKLIEINKESYK